MRASRLVARHLYKKFISPSQAGKDIPVLIRVDRQNFYEGRIYEQQV